MEYNSLERNIFKRHKQNLILALIAIAILVLLKLLGVLE